MLVRYNTEAASPSCDTSWIHSVNLLNPSKDNNNDDHYFIPDIPSSKPIPRSKVATFQCRPPSTLFQPRNSLQPPSEYPFDPQHQSPIDDQNEDFRYNIPLQERFHQQKTMNIQEP